MSVVNKLYIGREADLELLHEEDIQDLEILVNDVDEDGNETPHDFTGFTDINMFIYDKNTRSKLLETLVATTNFTIPIPTNGKIIFNLDYSADIDISPGEYYYKFTYLDSAGKPVTVGFETFTIRR